jgi:hypothetical protein
MYIFNNLVQEPSHLSNVSSLLFKDKVQKLSRANLGARASFHVIKKVNMNFNG